MITWYLLGVLVDNILLYLCMYYIYKKITLGDMVWMPFIMVLSWVSAITMLLIGCAAIIGHIITDVNWNKILWKRE